MSKLLGFILLTLAVASGTAAQEVPATESKPAVAEPEPVSPAAPVPSKTPADTTAKAPRKGAAQADRLDLETTVVSGNRELPKVLYIVPWKKADLGELPAQPFNTLLDEVLQPVDRDVFKREVKYFHAVTGTAATPAPVTSP